MQVSPRGILALSIVCLPMWAATPTSVPGIENFHQVDQSLYRGAQPTADGYRYLRSIGIKLVIDLREYDQRSVAEEKQVTAAGMRYVNVPMSGLTPPTSEQINKVLDLMEDPSAGPVFVHCKRGADRTGAVVAAYRIEHDSWDNNRALAEAMTNHMSHLQIPRQRYIRAFQARANLKPVDTSAGGAASQSAIATVAPAANAKN